MALTQINNTVTDITNLTANNASYLGGTPAAGFAALSGATFTGNVNLNNDITIQGQTNLEQISEMLNTKTSATGTVAHDLSTGAIWFHSSVSSNFTANIINAPTTDNRVLSVAIAVNQGITGYYPNNIQINGDAQTIRWQGNTAPTPSTNKIDIYSYNLIRTGNVWYVLGSATSH